MRSRDEHLEWSKEQARRYLNRGEAANAITSMLSDLRRHPELKGIAEKLTIMGLLYAANNDLREASLFVEGFN